MFLVEGDPCAEEVTVIRELIRVFRSPKMRLNVSDLRRAGLSIKRIRRIAKSRERAILNNV